MCKSCKWSRIKNYLGEANEVWERVLALDTEGIPVCDEDPGFHHYDNDGRCSACGFSIRTGAYEFPGESVPTGIL